MAIIEASAVLYPSMGLMKTANDEFFCLGCNKSFAIADPPGKVYCPRCGVPMRPYPIRSLSRDHFQVIDLDITR
jgi:predicted RNA-binding Zn-ribbon protein involved in translation (DUF1610 family)